ncbi:PE family protein [Mycobacterium tuberculosis]|uniref:PE family protein n=1 Tax=Mycobacterium tuberculosis TaxID=1773 RepID=UPI0027B887FE|nr:PE family protein [Mycobacterium tuberculosis]
MLAAAGDEVSAAIAALFGGFGLEYQAISAQVAAYHQRFVQALSTGAGAYASAGPPPLSRSCCGRVDRTQHLLLQRLQR